MQYMINGTKYSFSTILADAVAISLISNANPAKATAAALPTDGDIVLIDSNWTDLSDIATYAKNPAAGQFELAGIDTTDTNVFYPGEDAPSSYRIASGFTTLSQIREITQSGGDQNTFAWGYIDDRSMRQRSRPTDQNPLVLTFTMDYDPDKTWADELEKLSKNKQLVVMREQLPTGDVLIYTGYVGYQKSPSRTRNENMTVTATMTINSDTMRFPKSFFTGS